MFVIDCTIDSRCPFWHLRDHSRVFLKFSLFLFTVDKGAIHRVGLGCLMKEMVELPPYIRWLPDTSTHIQEVVFYSRDRGAPVRCRSGEAYMPSSSSLLSHTKLHTQYYLPIETLWAFGGHEKVTGRSLDDWLASLDDWLVIMNGSAYL